MKFEYPIVILLAIGLFAAGCDQKQAPAEQPTAAEPSQTAQSQESAEPAAKPAPQEKGGSPDAEALAALDAMDGRKPVPLIPMMANHQKQQMRDHLVAVQQVVHAAAAGDFAAVEKAATAIGSSEQMTQMCNHMGAGAPGFTEKALGFHKKADGIIEAAKAKDSKAVLTALDETLTACTSCHAEYKQQVVGQQAWSEKTGMNAPSHHQ
jgi:hypothetical protein